MTAHSPWLDIIYTFGVMSRSLTLPLPTDDRDILVSLSPASRLALH